MKCKYQFYRIKQLTPGMSYGAYWAVKTQEHGRGVFRMVLKAGDSGLVLDPWDDGSERPVVRDEDY